MSWRVSFMTAVIFFEKKIEFAFACVDQNFRLQLFDQTPLKTVKPSP